MTQALRRVPLFATPSTAGRNVRAYPSSRARLGTGNRAYAIALARAMAELLVTDLSQTGRIRVLERLEVQLLLDRFLFGKLQVWRRR